MFYYYSINFTITRNDIVFNDAVCRMKSLINHVSSAAVLIVSNLTFIWWR